jgi:hypothetical protein
MQAQKFFQIQLLVGTFLLNKYLAFLSLIMHSLSTVLHITLLVLLCACCGKSATFYWAGGSGNWEVSGNWDGQGGIPGIEDDGLRLYLPSITIS